MRKDGERHSTNLKRSTNHYTLLHLEKLDRAGIMVAGYFYEVRALRPRFDVDFKGFLRLNIPS